MTRAEHSIDATPQSIPARGADLAALDARALTAHAAAVNETHAAAQRAYAAARDGLAALLTEQIARRVLDLHPAAYMLQVRGAAEYHLDPLTGLTDPTCAGHEHRLTPCEVLTADGTVLGRLEDLDPVCYYLERLSPLLGTEDAVLTLPDRGWAYGRVTDTLAADESF